MTMYALDAQERKLELTRRMIEEVATPIREKQKQNQKSEFLEETPEIPDNIKSRERRFGKAFSREVVREQLRGRLGDV